MAACVFRRRLRLSIATPGDDILNYRIDVRTPFLGVRQLFEDKKRTDGLWTAAGGVNFRITDYLAVGLSYRFMTSQSLELFTFDRHLVSLAVFGQL